MVIFYSYLSLPENISNGSELVASANCRYEKKLSLGIPALEPSGCLSVSWMISDPQFVMLGLPSGERLHFAMENHHAINGKSPFF